MAKELGATDAFRDRLKELLDEQAAKNSLFAQSYRKENKNIDDCVKYVLGVVSKKKVNGFTTGEVVGMAMHYYDEDKVEVGSMPSVKRIIIDQPSEEEKKQAREESLRRYTVDHHKRMTGKKVSSSAGEIIRNHCSEQGYYEATYETGKKDNGNTEISPSVNTGTGQLRKGAMFLALRQADKRSYPLYGLRE